MMTMMIMTSKVHRTDACKEKKKKKKKDDEDDDDDVIPD